MFLSDFLLFVAFIVSFSRCDVMMIGWTAEGRVHDVRTHIDHQQQQRLRLQRHSNI